MVLPILFINMTFVKCFIYLFTLLQLFIMKSLFIDIRKKIKKDPMFSDFYVDENYGQLDSEPNLYKVAFPCILLDITQTEWDNLTHGSQVGTFTVKASLAIDCDDQEELDVCDDEEELDDDNQEEPIACGCGDEGESGDSGDEEVPNDWIDERIKAREKCFNRMHRLLHNFTAKSRKKKYTPLIRKSFQTRSLPGFIKVYECIYTCTEKELTAPHRLVCTKRKPLTIHIDPVLDIPKKFVVPELEDSICEKKHYKQDDVYFHRK